MTKLTLNNVGSLIDATTAQTTLNSNNAATVTAMENTLSRNGDTPNQMQAPLDMNSNHILNLPAPVGGLEPLRLQDLSDFNGGGTIATIPPGGNTNDILVKNSNANYDLKWTTESSNIVAGTNIAVTGSSPAVVSTVTSPTFSGTATAAQFVGGGAGITGLNVSNIGGLGTGVGTWLGTPSSANLAAAVTGETGTGALVFGTSPTIATATLTTPTMTTPVLGAATATSINKVAITAPATSATLTLTDGTTVTGPATTGTLVTKTSTDTLTNKTFDTGGTGNSFLIGGTAVTAQTGTGSIVRSTSPTLVTPVLGAATATTINGATLDNTAWTTYTPTSSFTTPGTSVMGSAAGRYKQIGKVVFFSVDCTVTTAGTANGSWAVGLPVAASVVGATWPCVAGRESATLGVLLAVSQGSSTTINCVQYNNTSLALGGNGTRIFVGGSYEAA